MCERCTGREGPAIIAASILVPTVLVGVPLLVLRIERTRAFAYKYYHRYIDVGKFKVRARSLITRAAANHRGALTGRLR